MAMDTFMNMTQKLYSFGFVARRQNGPASDTGVGTGIGLAASETDAEEQATEAAFDAFPIDQGWEEHEIVVQEVEQGFQFNDGQRLIWRAEKTPSEV